MTPTTHDYDAQRQETFDTFGEADVDLPERAVVDFLFFVEEADANWQAFEAELHTRGFETRREDEGDTLAASIGPILITAEEIWAQERVATEIALRHDFYPDGWELDVEVDDDADGED
ncbi:ribonuclease E inhibitor RraB [Pseudoruegeria sp. SK021]|uniref:ribonuclease E inhibitor RraB n=1 Tax=Pseudoruegeria sp. SK021 TaxID=1933035 RepID=UPI000A25A10E|nr:ribonuclease E inhibitor RraB [Pseudoruegeria sp. SK021]OSP54409.1 hypothetical protein BV911_12460 [Pseudoruegeria sp. SK021]